MGKREEGQRINIEGLETDGKRKNSVFHGGQIKHVLEKMVAWLSVGCSKWNLKYQDSVIPHSGKSGGWGSYSEGIFTKVVCPAKETLDQCVNQDNESKNLPWI